MLWGSASWGVSQSIFWLFDTILFHRNLNLAFCFILSIFYQNSKGHLPLSSSLPFPESVHSWDDRQWLTIINFHKSFLEWLWLILSASSTDRTLLQSFLFSNTPCSALVWSLGLARVILMFISLLIWKLKFVVFLICFLVFSGHGNWFLFHLISFSLLFFFICMHFGWRIVCFGFNWCDG